MDTDRPTLTADDCHALREFSGMTWCVRGRWVSLGEILDSWVDATMRAQYSASARAEALAARVAELEAQVKNLVWRDEAATRERVGWVEKCRELESELSATERTADAERERAKRAERLLESESARVAEMEASLSSTETHRQSLAHELSRAQQLDEASLKTIARKALRDGCYRYLSRADGGTVTVEVQP